MGSGIIGGFGAGLLVGIDRGLQRKREQEIEDKKLAQEQERYDSEKRARDRAEQDSISLRNAATPATVNDNGATVSFGDGQQHVYDDAGVANSDVRQFNRMGEAAAEQAPVNDPSQIALSAPRATQAGAITVNGTAYPDRPAADKAAADYNSPVALSNRVSGALLKAGKPTEAMQYQTQAQKFADQTWDTQLRDAMTRGHQGLADFMTKSQAGVLAGKTIKAVPSEDGKTVTYNIVNTDGSMTPTPYTLPNDQNGVISAAYQLAKIDPETRYRHMVEADKTTFTQDAKEKELTLRERELTEVKIPTAETRAKLAEVQASLAELRAQKANNTNGADSEDRKKWTSLLGESGRRITDSMKALGTLQRDPVFMAKASKPGSQEAQQMADARAELQMYKEDRDLYSKLLAGSAGSAARAEREGGAATPPIALTPAAPAASSTKVPPAVQTQRDGDRQQILNDELTKAQQRLATGDPRAQGDIDALQKELARGKGGSTAKAPTARPGASRANPVAVNDRAGRDQLPKGTYYKAPNGEVYIKQ